MKEVVLLEFGREKVLCLSKRRNPYYEGSSTTGNKFMNFNFYKIVVILIMKEVVLLEKHFHL